MTPDGLGAQVARSGGMRRSMLGLAMILAAPAFAADGDLLTVAGMQNHNRVLIAFAPTLGDSRLEAQRAEFAHFGAGAATRDLLFVQVAADKVLGSRDSAATLRRKFHVGVGDYRAILIGKDGTAALTEQAPIVEARLQAAIDAMPMRQEEVRRAKAGLGKGTP